MDAADKIALTSTQASDQAPRWRLVVGRLHLSVAAPDFATALAFTDRVGAIADEVGHHPDIDLRWGFAHVATSSHDVGAITLRDIRLAQRIDAVVDEMGLDRVTTRLDQVEIAIDALDIDAVRPFWSAVLGWPGSGDLADPDGIGPTVWFQQMDSPRPQRNRIHVDVSVPHDAASERIENALSAGGRLVSDADAPSFWVLADPEGNEACISTWQGRD